MGCMDDVVIAAPCPMTWEEMAGDDRVRHCCGCAKNVYNIADMTKKEAEEFFQENGATQCIRIFRRTDGKMMTDNCPRGLRAIRNRMRIALRFVAGIAASFFAFIPGLRGVPAFAQDAPDIKGDVYVPPKQTQQKKNPEPEALGGKPMMAPTEVRGNIALPSQVKKTTKQIMIGGEGCQSKGASTVVPAVAPVRAIMGESSATMPPTNTNTEGANATPSAAPDSIPGLGQEKQIIHRMGRTAMPHRTGQPTQAPAKETAPKKSDSKAHKLYLQAVESENHGKLLVAQTQYQDAIKAAHAQENGDPNFLSMLNKSLSRLQSHMMQAAD